MAGSHLRGPAVRRLWVMLALTASVLVPVAVDFPSATAAVCDPPVLNPVACENTLPGTPAAQWTIGGAGDPSIQGFATDVSVQHGDTVHFKIKTPATAYHLDIFRVGYYQGIGARRVASSILPSASLPQTQPACLFDGTTGLIDCGNWAESATWSVPSTAVSGVYFALLKRDDVGVPTVSQIFFDVRDDSSHADILYQTDDTTYNAYNRYGGSGLYACSPGFCPPGVGSHPRAYKVSFNRPNTAADVGLVDSFWHSEFAMVKWLEQNGYNVSYQSGVDTDRLGPSVLQQHRVFVSSGHDEYWSAGQRANVEAARDSGVSLAFFSGNEIFWKIRYESSTDGSSTAYRTEVSYKETHNNAPLDPQDPPTWTGTWRDPRFSPPADGGRPENALSGTLYSVNGSGVNYAIEVPAADGKMRFWRNTTVATQAPGSTATLAPNTLGFEWDSDVDNAVRPAGLFHVSSTTESVTTAVSPDNGTVDQPGVVTHSMTLYRASSGALVFGAGTIQWAWGLSGAPDGTPADVRMQQATVNLLADMGAQPTTLQAGLVPASVSTDTTPPISLITSPSSGATVHVGSSVTISGVALDPGGQVAGVDISTDGGVSWHPASGRSSWSYTWNVQQFGAVTLRSRAVDDSGNLETPGAGVSVQARCPCQLWSNSVTPGTVDGGDPGANVELGVKFTADVDGTVSGVRFYKSAANTGTHTGSLWSASGVLLATVTFADESASGWQQATFSSPVDITAGQTYVVSYHTTAGHYSLDFNYFASQYNSGPLHAPASGTSGGNGVFRYGPSDFPSQSFQAANYWVDLVFDTPTETTPPVFAPPGEIGQPPISLPPNSGSADLRSTTAGPPSQADAPSSPPAAPVVVGPRFTG